MPWKCASASGFCSKLKYHLKFKHNAALKALQNRGESQKAWPEGLFKEQQQNGDISVNVLLPYFSLGGKNSIRMIFGIYLLGQLSEGQQQLSSGFFFFLFFFLSKPETCWTRKVYSFEYTFFPERQTFCNSLELVTESIIPVINSSFHSWFKEFIAIRLSESM